MNSANLSEMSEDSVVSLTAGELRAIVEAAVAAERERCARIADDYHEWCANWAQHHNQVTAQKAANEIAARIRAALKELQG